MLGFLISFILIFVSSYFIASIFTPKEGKYRCSAFLITLGTMFAQIVLSCEILSLFKAINNINILITNTVCFIASLIFWIKKGKPLYFPNLKNTIKKIWFVCKKDKFLLLMTLGLIFFVIISITICIISPIKNFDALAYHLNRSAFWLFQGSLNHFDTTDIRNLVMPINSEILYLWVLAFFKNDIGLGLFSFFGYLTCAFSLYNILGYFNFSERRKWWSVVIMSSLASVVVEASSSETDILIAGMILSSIYLFLVALKEKSLSIIFFSSLIYALATGTKSPAIIAFPGVFSLIAFFAYKQYKKDSLKPLMLFCGFLFINFVIFSSYNYILNFMDYRDFLGSESAKVIHGFRGGIKAFVANYIRYIFSLFDFSGFSYSKYVGDCITNARLALFEFLHIPIDIGVEISDENIINNRLQEASMGTGLLGFLLFLPSVLTAILIKGFKTLCKNDSEKISTAFAFATVFFINIFCLSFSLAYFVFSIRFVTTMVLISSPVLALSYFKKNYLLKIIILFFVLSYFIVMSQNIVGRNLKEMLNVYSEEETIYDARERIRCAPFKGYQGKNSFCYLRDLIKENISPDSHIGLISNYNARLYTLKMLEKYGFKIDTILPEKIESYDLKQFDYIIITNEQITSLTLLHNTKDTIKRLTFDKDGELVIPNGKPTRCEYYDHDTKLIINKNRPNQVIYASYCMVTQDYFEENGFKYIQQLKFDSPVEQEKNTIVIFKNINH